MGAFLLVLLDHMEVAGPLAGFGLPVFLLLTGFLTTSSLLHENDKRGAISVRAFWARRARRILPALLGYLATATALLCATGIRVDWAHLASTVLQVGNYYEAVRGPQESYLSHTWSLGLQEQFVLFWPFAVLLLGGNLRRLGVATAATIAAVWLWRSQLSLVGVDQSYLYRAFETRIDGILVGSLIAITVRGRLWAGPVGWLARHPMAALVAAVLVLGTSGHLQVAFGASYRDTVGGAVDQLGLAVLLVLLATFGAAPAMRWTRWRLLTWLGTVSYGMYLYHSLAISTVLRVIPGHGPLQVALAFALSAIAGAVSYHVVERRFLSDARRRERTPGRIPAATRVAAPHGPTLRCADC